MDPIALSQVSGNANVAGGFASYLPEPAVTGVGIFRDAMDVVSSASDSVLGSISSATGGDFAALLQLQIEAQREMQTTSMVSNVEHSKHESKMAAIRNMRIG